MDQLIERVRRGEKDAILEFYKFYSPRIAKFLSKKVPKEEAREILNDVFFDAIDEIPLLKNTENISGWLYRIAHNKSVDYYRKNKIKSIVLSELPFLQIAAKEIQQPEFQYDLKQLREKIEQAMNKISEKYKQILKLHYEEGLKVKELAVFFKLTPKAAESMLYRARKEFIRQYTALA